MREFSGGAGKGIECLESAFISFFSFFARDLKISYTSEWPAYFSSEVSQFKGG